MNKHSFQKFFRSLRTHTFLVVFLVGVLPATFVFFLFSNLYVSRALESDVTDIVANGQALSRQIISTGYLSEQSSAEVTSELEALSNAYGGRVMLVDSSLKIVSDTYGADEGKTIVWSYVLSVFSDGTYSYYYNAKDAYLVVAVPMIAADSDDTVQGVLMINKSMTYIASNLEYFQSVAIVTLLLLYILMLVLALVFSRRVSRPYRKLAAAIGAQDYGNGTTKEIAVTDFTETSDVSERMNALIGRMRIVDESRQEFVSNVSHELKTPLTSMKVLADSLNSMEGAPVELYQEFMADIGNEIERETKIINDLLSLVKMDKAAATLDVSAVNMNELIELILKRLRPIAEKQQVELVFESFRPVVAEVDELKISLAVTNLVENAIKYNEENGWVHVTLNADHRYCFIKVRDSGMGIPEESLDYIFERFYRVDKSHSREIGGTGLGLAITKSVVNMHDGDIRVASILGEGTTFEVRIPLNHIAEQGEVGYTLSGKEVTEVQMTPDESVETEQEDIEQDSKDETVEGVVITSIPENPEKQEEAFDTSVEEVQE